MTKMNDEKAYFGLGSPS